MKIIHIAERWQGTASKCGVVAGARNLTMDAEHEAYKTEHERCIEQIQADQLATAERENELHEEKDRQLAEAHREIERLKAEHDRLFHEKHEWVRRAEQAERVRDEVIEIGVKKLDRIKALEHDLTDTRAERERLRDERRRLWEDTRQLERSREQAEARVRELAEKQGCTVCREAILSLREHVRVLEEALDTLLGCFLVNPRTGELGLDATKAIASRVAEARAVLTQNNLTSPPACGSV